MCLTAIKDDGTLLRSKEAIPDKFRTYELCLESVKSNGAAYYYVPDMHRKKELQTGNSNELYINRYFETKYPYKLEKMLHRHFHNKKLINEWFSLDDDDIKSFKETCSHYEEICDALKDNPFF